MIRSMTGYGAATAEGPGARGAVTLRGLNHRFLEVVCHAPRKLAPLEAEIRDLVAKRQTRGRVEVTIQANGALASAHQIAVSKPLVGTLVEALRGLQAEFGLEGGVTVSDILRFPGAVEASEAPASIDPETRESLLALTAQAVDALTLMREDEGSRLSGDLRQILDGVEAAASRIERLSAEGRDAKRALLQEKVRELQGDLGLEEPRLYQEIARAVERHDVAEEVQRLRSHVVMARDLMGSGEACGKRLDFLAQELMREANTVGSKAPSATLAHEVVDLKNRIERFREQVQNVE
jgi:uncharacterized protein (TIGR00255 family)